MGCALLFQALGGQLLDRKGHHLTSGGGALVSLEKIIMPNHLTGITWRVACDVQNPLLGPQGASAVYGPQKGASQKGVEQLEKSLTHFSKIIEQQCHQKVTLLEGGGAAGGTAAGMVGFFGAQLTSGFGLLSELIGLNKRLNKQILFLLPKGKSTNNRYKVKFLWAWHESQKNMAKNALVWRGLLNLLFLLYMTKGLAEFLISNKAQLAFKNRRKTPISCSVQLLDVFFNFT